MGFKTVNGMSSCTGVWRPPYGLIPGYQFQNRKRYEFLYRQTLNYRIFRKRRHKFQNRKRYEFLYRHCAKRTHDWRISLCFKTVNGMSSCTGLQCKW